MKLIFPTKNLIRPAWLLLAVLFTIFLVCLPVLFFELTTNRSADFSFAAIADGSLVNLTEKQLFEDKFQMALSSDRALIFNKNDTMIVGHKTIPVSILVRFTSALYDDEEFREPVSLDLLFSDSDDSLIFGLLNQVMQNDIAEMQKFNGRLNLPQIKYDDSVKEWPYYLKQNLYFFRYKDNYRAGINSIFTNIFSGKLFLMLKYYVVKIYSYTPSGYQPGWFSKMHSLK